MLTVANLSKQFGGVHAVQDVSFTIPQGCVYSVIGPNGAGKTTLFNLISGLYTPTSGSIRFEGQDISGQAPDRLARRGMSRTFQNLQICKNLSAIDNVMVGAHLTLNASMFAGMFRWPGLARADRACRERAAALMERVGCGDFITADAAAMPYGALKRLEIARALASDPKILFLDEPAAGLNHTETHSVQTLVAELARSGLTVVVVEHDMKLVMSVSDRILVLNYGRRLAEGTPADIRENPDVIAAYLGADTEEE
ncbi:ABC transporter ATP-binding protein [Azospirillum griseum]|uniref:ABC transporter ATP-binding protein n=1 Tax=Azospirillum griseum TaxID=2496639 RepID=A0A431VFK1_9PROT|nr:ABC transporter ATP-binding protein [Azospirillum griseum]RTR18635.1 ABC transporter ATP-binding protein [Azospirillum griseum]